MDRALLTGTGLHLNKEDQVEVVHLVHNTYNIGQKSIVFLYSPPTSLEPPVGICLTSK
jgi:hypothetical protein